MIVYVVYRDDGSIQHIFDDEYQADEYIRKNLPQLKPTHECFDVQENWKEALDEDRREATKASALKKLAAANLTDGEMKILGLKP